jgi:acetone carboxylase gamma subunit
LTDTLRRRLRDRRLSEGRPVAAHSTAAQTPAATAQAGQLRIGEALHLIRAHGKSHYACRKCGLRLCGADQDPKSGALAREVKMETLSPWNRYCLADEVVLREFCCPGCAHLIAVEVRKTGDPVLYDTDLH